MASCTVDRTVDLRKIWHIAGVSGENVGFENYTQVSAFLICISDGSFPEETLLAQKKNLEVKQCDLLIYLYGKLNYFLR